MLRSISVVAGVLSMGLLCSAGGSEPAPARFKRPNVVFIMADDHCRQAVGCYGSKLIQTPGIDRLASEGVRFTHAFACNSICSPSRATLLTGKYNHLCGVRKLSESFDGSQQTFPKLLQKAGYQTAIIGKWHLETEPTGFDYYSVLPGQGRYYDPQFKQTGKPWNAPGNKGLTLREGYVTDIITEMGIDWLKNRPADKPFCLMLHHKAPHSPHNPAPRHKDLFADKVFPEPANLLDDYAARAPSLVADQLSWSRLIQQPEPQYKPLIAQLTGERSRDTKFMFQEYTRNYLRLVAALDESVARTLDYLETSGLAENTVVIYTSDNGYFLGEHGFYNKMWMYEESLHLPLLVRLPKGWKGFKPGSVLDELVGMHDIAPTLLDFAGAIVPADIQGRSIRPLLEGKPSRWRDASYYHYYGTILPSRENNWIASHEVVGIRTKTAKLVYYPTWKGGPFWEYFDLTSDPSEMKNLFADPAHQKAVEQMRTRFRNLAVDLQDHETVTSLDAVRSAEPQSKTANERR